MTHLGWSNALTIIPLISGLTFGWEVYNISVCEGDSIKLFNSVEIIQNDTDVHLYKNGIKHRLIASLATNMTSIIKENVVIDSKQNLWIINVHTENQGLYILQYDHHNEKSYNLTKDLSVWVAPASTCKPNITETGNILTATLSDHNCGNPIPSAYFKDCSSLICADPSILRLEAGRKAGRYYACTTGSALSCARSSDPSSDYCSFIQIEESTGGHTTQTGSDFHNDDLHKWVIPIILQSVVLVLVLPFGINAWRTLIILCCTRNPGNNPSGVNPNRQELIPLRGHSSQPD